MSSRPSSLRAGAGIESRIAPTLASDAHARSLDARINAKLEEGGFNVRAGMSGTSASSSRANNLNYANSASNVGHIRERLNNSDLEPAGNDSEMHSVMNSALHKSGLHSKLKSELR
jgi:hypothetical protein